MAALVVALHGLGAFGLFFLGYYSDHADSNGTSAFEAIRQAQVVLAYAGAVGLLVAIVPAWMRRWGFWALIVGSVGLAFSAFWILGLSTYSE